MKLLKYNPFHTYPNLDQLQPYWSKFFLGHLIEKYKKIPLEEINHSVVDRTGSIPHFLNMRFEPLPPLQKSPPPLFWECMILRVLSLLDKKKPINLMWSGGLDSTAMLGTFLALAKPEELKRLRVILTYNSVLESGSIFDRFVKNNFRYHLTTTQYRGDLYKQFPSDELFVTGGLGDQLFGRSDLLETFTENQLFEPFEDHIDRNLLEFCQPPLEKFPTKIKTLFDFGWFYSFNFSWQSVKYHHDVMIDPAIQPRIINFYGSEDFQRWAVSARDIEPSILKGHKNSYKWPLREIIRGTIRDQHYVNNKTKMVSQHSYTAPDWLALREDGTTLYLHK
jgi:hypothetical protein